MDFNQYLEKMNTKTSLFQFMKQIKYHQMGQFRCFQVKKKTETTFNTTAFSGQT